jgi:hypothetical protein
MELVMQLDVLTAMCHLADEARMNGVFSLV